MKPIHNKILIFFLSVFSLFAFGAKAVCPVCVVAVGSGVGLCRWLGIDDVITGLWIGGLTVAVIIWFLDWLAKRNINFKFKNILVWVSFYVFVLFPLYSFNIIGHPLNKIWGTDKLLFGIFLGSFAFLFSIFLNGFLKKKNNGKVFFPYQKVAIPVLLLLILSIVFYIIEVC
jgi:hypothetical protein